MNANLSNLWSWLFGAFGKIVEEIIKNAKKGNK